MSQPDIRNLANCIDDARQAALDQDSGPPDPLQFHVLRGRLEAARPKIPPLYRQVAFNPFVQTLDELGETQFNEILISDPSRERAGGLMLDIAQAFLQRGEQFEPRAKSAFQEVVSDLYDGFLSAEDRRGVQPPDHDVVAPLVKFGNPDFCPYTYVDVQKHLNDFCDANNIHPFTHGRFWNKMKHPDFVTGNVPNVADDMGNPLKVLVPKDAKNSNIVMALRGAKGTIFDPDTGSIGRMPPGGPFMAEADIDRFADWIDRGALDGSK